MFMQTGCLYIQVPWTRTWYSPAKYLQSINSTFLVDKWTSTNEDHIFFHVVHAVSYQQQSLFYVWITYHYPSRMLHWFTTFTAIWVIADGNKPWWIDSHDSLPSLAIGQVSESDMFPGGHKTIVGNIQWLLALTNTNARNNVSHVSLCTLADLAARSQTLTRKAGEILVFLAFELMLTGPRISRGR